MKKSMAVILLGSALVMSNNNSAEASYSNNELKVQNVQYYVYEGKFSTYNPEEVNQYVNTYLNELEKYFGKNIEVSLQQSAVPVMKPVEGTPKEQAKPAEQPKAVEQPKAAEQPTPAEQPKPVQQPKPTEQAKPVEKAEPAVEEKSVETPVQNDNISAIEKAVLDLTNVERQKAGLQPLQIDKNLMNSARQKSTDMARNNYFSHTSPTYGSPFDQMKANGISYRSAAENIAMGQRSAEEVVKAWMESPGHRQNILTPNFTHIGIGYDANGQYWTQQFIQK